MSTVYIATATHNRLDILKKFVACIEEQTFRNWHLVVVDDGSTDGTGEYLDLVDNVTVLKGNGNLWWGGALQLIYEWMHVIAADDDILFISNDDVSYSCNYIETAVNILGEREKILLSGIGIDVTTGVAVDTPVIYHPEHFNYTKADIGSNKANCVSTRSLFLKVSTMKYIGGFHPILLPHYGSDYEWTIRACRKGCSIESSEQLSYSFDKETTGIKKLSLKTLFSKKSMYNPIYKVSYLLLTVIPRQIPTALSSILRRLFS